MNKCYDAVRSAIAMTEAMETAKLIHTQIEGEVSKKISTTTSLLFKK